MPTVRRKAAVTEYTSQSIVTRIVRDSKVVVPKVSTTAEAYELVKALQNEAVEKFVVMFMDVRHNVLALSVMFSGGMTEAIIDVRVVVKAALDIGATTIIIAHNHPSGDPNISREDKAITRKIEKAAELFDIVLMDHIVVGYNSYYSFAESGEI